MEKKEKQDSTRTQSKYCEDRNTKWLEAAAAKSHPTKYKQGAHTASE